MTNQSWIIGKDPSCDIVVAGRMVSSRHCQLTRTTGGYEIEDLGSTNGTFVNGRKIQAKQAIARSDRVTLGQFLALPWPDEADRSSVRTLSIGRALDNAIVLDLPNVSAYHARLHIAGNQIELEDLGSTNGTAVSRPENRITRAEVARSDAIYFGSTSRTVEQLLAMAGPLDLGSQPDRVAIMRRFQQHWPILAASVALLCLTVVAARLLRSDSDEMPGRVPESIGVAPETAELPPGVQVEVQTAGTEPMPTQQQAEVAASESEAPAASEPEVSKTIPKPTPPPVENSLFYLLVSDQAGDNRFRLGTAWAVADHHLVTTATSVRAIPDHADELPKALVFCPATGRELPIVATQVHPRNRKPTQEAARARDEYMATWNAFEQKGAPEDEQESVQQELTRQQLRFITATEEAMHYDIAVITVAEPLDSFLNVDSHSASLLPKQKVRLTGLAFDEEFPILVDGGNHEAAVVEGRIHRVTGLMTGQGVGRLAVECNADLTGQNWTGTPVLDASGAVLAIYSRIALPLDPSQSRDGHRIDAVLADTLNEFEDLTITWKR